MDPQLACATYATLIPVLLIAGHFSGEWNAYLGDVHIRRVVWVVAMAALLGETASIVGVFAPERWLAFIGMVGSGGAAAGIFTMAFARLVRAGDAEKVRRGHPEHDQRDD